MRCLKEVWKTFSSKIPVESFYISAEAVVAYYDTWTNQSPMEVLEAYLLPETCLLSTRNIVHGKLLTSAVNRCLLNEYNMTV